MTTTYELVYDEEPEASAWGIIGRGVGDYNREKGGDDNFQRLCYTVRSEDGEIAGGVLCELYWGWLYVDLLWVEEGLRGQGYGRRLMLQAEEEARRRGARNVYLDTFTFQAPAFYEKLGYTLFGELPNFPRGHTRRFYTKEL